MRSLALLLALLTPLTAAALSIQADEAELLRYPELLEECRAMGHGNSCDRELKRGDTIERETFEACLTFKSVEDPSPMDDDTPQFMKGPGFSRYRSCLKHGKGHTFNPKAVSVCSIMNDFIQHLECLDAVADKAFHSPSADACLKVAYTSTIKGLECLQIVEGKALAKSKIASCEKIPAGQRNDCFRSREQANLAACERKLSAVELKVQEISSSASGNRALKRSVKPILEVLKGRPPTWGNIPAQ